MGDLVDFAHVSETQIVKAGSNFDGSVVPTTVANVVYGHKVWQVATAGGLFKTPHPDASMFLNSALISIGGNITSWKLEAQMGPEAGGGIIPLASGGNNDPGQAIVFELTLAPGVELKFSTVGNAGQASCSVHWRKAHHQGALI